MNQEKTHPHHKKLTAIAFISVATLLTANLLVSNILATSGEQLRRLQQRNKNLKDQNAKLRQEIINKSALRTLETRAHNLGFVKSTQTFSLSSQPPVAMYQQ